MDWRRHIPTREALLSNRWVRPLAHRLTHPEIWHFHRRPVARGAALGLFVGLTVPLGQTPVAALLALPFRANLIVAAVATLITNPITFPLIYYAAYRAGTLVIGPGHSIGDHVSSGWLARWADWLAGASLPTAVGLLLFAIVAATLGYVGVLTVWRMRISRRWRARRRR